MTALTFRPYQPRGRQPSCSMDRCRRGAKHRIAMAGYPLMVEIHHVPPTRLVERLTGERWEPRKVAA